MVNARKLRTPCPVCGAEPARSFYTYCSNICQREFEYQLLIKRWKAGSVSGLQSTGTVATYVKKYLRHKFGNKCCVCGWSEVNKKTGLVPLVADHIDGNWRNNAEKNLRLLCPNCDALTPTYSALNKGRGRPGRASSKRASEARMLYKNKQNNSLRK